MNVVDSSGWLEFFADGPNAPFFAPAIEDTPKLVVPSICVFEVFKRVLQQRDDTSALRAVAFMLGGQVVVLDTSLALEAARLSAQERLPMADSVILATTRAKGALLWTQDADFQGLDDVKYVQRQGGP